MEGQWIGGKWVGSYVDKRVRIHGWMVGGGVGRRGHVDESVDGWRVDGWLVYGMWTSGWASTQTVGGWANGRKGWWEDTNVNSLSLHHFKNKVSIWFRKILNASLTH